MLNSLDAAFRKNSINNYMSTYVDIGIEVVKEKSALNSKKVNNAILYDDYNGKSIIIITVY